ncbi:MAG TPA: transmembrane 220 family protein [Chitinophagaceae bacterium]|nr:transmembrane 220 family protein [Chitinophagaceae bacterium]
MRWVNLVLVILFVVAAALQYNDPDPYVWIPLYGYGALFCWRCFRGHFHRVLFWIGLAVYVPYALYLLLEPEGVLAWIREHNAENIAQTMKATRPWIEATREFFGLLILIGALVLNAVVRRERSSPVH